MWKLVFDVVDVIFKFGSPKKKTHKIQKNNAPSKIFKNVFLEQINFLKNKNWNSYGLMKIWSNFIHSKVLNY
jgi:hypothetical protein